MGEQWYYAQDDQQQGPVSLEQLKEFAKTGEVGPSDLVWTDKMEDWTPASEVGELEFPAPPTSLPPTLPPRPTAGVPRPSARQRLDSLSEISPMVWSLLMIAGAGLLFLAFFVPWWGIEIESGEDASRKEREEASEVQDENFFWYLQHVRPVSKINDSDGVTLWGWNTGTGITGLVFVFLILPLAILPLCINALKPWAWIGRFLVAIAGCVMLVMFAIWFFGAPSKNVSPVLSQGLYLGPYVVFLAAVALLLSGVVGGTLGLVAFLNEFKSGAAGQDAAPTKAATGADQAEIEFG